MFCIFVYRDIKNVRLVSFNLDYRGNLDYLLLPNIYRTRLTLTHEHSKALFLVIELFESVQFSIIQVLS